MMSRPATTLRKMPAAEDMFHEHIAATYFQQKTKKKKQKAAPKHYTRLALTVVAAVVLLSAVSAAAVSLHHRYLASVMASTDRLPVISLFSGGKLNRDVIRGLEFRGYARGKSRFSDKMIVFNTPRKYDWAAISIDLRFPIDATRRSIFIALKGNVGGERVTLVARDLKNRSCRLGDVYLTSQWKNLEIPFDGVKDQIDIANIDHIRIECGYIGESRMDSPVDLTVFIKEIRITKEV